jgi:hypothetical protein
LYQPNSERVDAKNLSARYKYNKLNIPGNEPTHPPTHRPTNQHSQRLSAATFN